MQATDGGREARLARIAEQLDIFAKELHVPPYFFDEPRLPRVAARVKQPWNPNGEVVGAFDLDDGRARLRCLGEAIERVCQAQPLQPVATFRTFESIDSRALDPKDFARTSDATGKVHTWKIPWVKAQHLQSGEAVLAPLEAVYLWSPETSGRHLRRSTTSGTAFGLNEEEALYRALCETVERDAFLIHYLTRRSPGRFRAEHLPESVRALVRYFSQYRLEVHLFDIALDIPVPTSMAIVVDRTDVGPSVSVGTSCGLDLIPNLTKSILEAQQARFFTRIAMSGGAPDGPDVLAKRALGWVDADGIERLEFFLKSEREPAGPSSAPTAKDFIEHFPFDAYVADLSRPGMESARTLRVLVPELVPLYLEEEDLPASHPRLLRYAGEKGLNPVPHPFL